MPHHLTLSRKLPPAVYGNKYRNLNNVKTKRDLRIFSLNGVSFSNYYPQSPEIYAEEEVGL